MVYPAHCGRRVGIASLFFCGSEKRAVWFSTPIPTLGMGECMVLRNVHGKTFLLI